MSEQSDDKMKEFDKFFQENIPRAIWHLRSVFKKVWDAAEESGFTLGLEEGIRRGGSR